MYTIYKYTNTVNGKVYIGQTSKTLAERAQSGGRNYRECSKFYNAINKYSWSAFVPEILCVVQTQDEANRMEEYYISMYNSTSDDYGYNLLPGGGNRVMSEETRSRISAAAKQRYQDKTANPMYGRKHSEDALAKMRACKLGANNPMYGRKWTDTQREKCGTKGKHINMSESQREMLRERMTRLGHMNAKQVKCEEDNIVFDSLMTAAAFYHVAIGTLSGHLHSYQKSCAGKHFSFID